MLDLMRSRAAARILKYYRETAHPNAVLLPRARIGLHAIARNCLSPGDRILVSPLTCHTVMEAFIQGGVVPVFADIDTRDGNIDVARLRPDLLRKVKAMVTTNLYGNPDQAIELAGVARRYGLLLVEDCAHVFETTLEGRRIGTIGDLSVFSFKKFFDVAGGVVTGRDPETIRRIRDWLSAYVRMPSAVSELAGWARGLPGSGRVRKILGFHRRIAGPNKPWQDEVGKRGSSGAPGGDAKATRCDMADFRSMTVAASLETVASYLDAPEKFRDGWNRGNTELILRAGMEYRKSPYPSSVVHMAVPFSCPDRDALLSRLRGSGIPVWFLYNPPMNFLYESAADQGNRLDLDRLEEWRRSILPLPGRFAERVLSGLAASKSANEQVAGSGGASRA